MFKSILKVAMLLLPWNNGCDDTCYNKCKQKQIKAMFNLQIHHLSVGFDFLQKPKRFLRLQGIVNNLGNDQRITF